MEKRWIFRELPAVKEVGTLSQMLNINSYLTSLLLQRGIRTFEEAKNYFRPSLNHLHDPFLMKNMEKAVNRLCEAIHNKEKILIYGDYDVDGTTSVALVYSFLKKYTSQIEYYIPDRYTEGYGISEKGILWAAENGFTLMISLDCGIKAINTAVLAKESGIDLIVCDHHLPGDYLPDAYAILDPKQSDDHYPYKELSGCGVGFKLLQGFCMQNTLPLEDLFEYLDLVAVSIASDIVAMTGENRILTYYGLKKINQNPSPALSGLIEISGLKPPISVSDIVFYIGPRINATGRLTHAKESVKLLVSDEVEEIGTFSDYLNARNAERKTYDQTITAEALEMIETSLELANARSTVLFKETWHKGVIGIVASRCIEKYYRPTIILTLSKNKATGSARSVDGFDVHSAISQCSEFLDQFGGHMYAAGLTLPIENVEKFRQKFEEVVTASILPDQLIPRQDIDLEVPFEFITFKSLGIIDQMAPFGPGNLQPTFCTSNVRLKGEPRVLKDQHLKFCVYQQDGGKTMEAIGFGLAGKLELITSGKPFSIAYCIDKNDYLGNKTLQLNIKDIRID